MYLRGLITRTLGALRDPIVVAMEREEIKAAARYWRERIANARIAEVLDGGFETLVNSPFNDTELDLFEHAIANQLAIAMANRWPGNDSNALFQERGLDVTGYVTLAARAVGLKTKITYNGFHTRMRILVGKEVSYEHAPYQSGDWTKVWSAVEEHARELLAA
jgi:hypothetical protein